MNTLAQTGNMPAILEIENILKQCEQVNMPVSHHFMPGVYMRKLCIPAGTVLTGKIHNFENIAMLLRGTIKIDNGTESKELSAPQIWIDQAGVKRLGYAVTDVEFVTMHNTNGGTLAEIEQELASDTFDEFEQKLVGKL